MEADFSGYATKAGLKCSDGRVITPEAFKHQDKMTVPLVWQHGHNSPENVLGHATLEARDDGIYAYGFFNQAPQGRNALKLVEHKDIQALSIYANQLVEKSKQVLHGAIREVSLVLSGANPGALIDYVRVAHSDGEVEVLEDEAVIYTGLELQHATATATKTDSGGTKQATTPRAGRGGGPVVTEPPEPGEGTPAEEEEDRNDPNDTVQEIYDTLTDVQKQVVHYMIGAALDAAASAQHSDLGPDASVEDVFNTLSDEQKAAVQSMIGSAVEEAGAAAHSATAQEGNAEMNVFEQNGAKPSGPTLSHDQIQTIVEDAQKLGSFKESLLAHAGDYGIDNIDVLFPNATLVTQTPEFISRRMEWVAAVLNGTKHSPFARIKSTAADITAEEARAKGYVKGSRKKDEVIKLLKRVTTPTTIYKKQRLDRDDIVDITDLDVVAWLKAEMRLMLDEELARAVLVGDGREADDEDKVDEDHIRPIAYDDDMYAHKVTLGAGATNRDIMQAILRNRVFYKGTGTPTLFTTDAILTDLLLQEDQIGRRLYATIQELAAALRVQDIVPVEVMNDYVSNGVVGIMVNLVDYTLGADQGGQIGMFDNFDIDYNQYRYLIETRVSGALTKPKSALVIFSDPGTLVTPTSPSFDGPTNTITIPTVPGVVYTIDGRPVTGTVVIDETTDVNARAASGHTFARDTNTNWTFIHQG